MNIDFFFPAHLKLNLVSFLPNLAFEFDTTDQELTPKSNEWMCIASCATPPISI
jgi:hypothetical protein